MRKADNQTDEPRDDSSSEDVHKSRHEEADEKAPAHDDQKRGERPDNLRRRAEWFQKRHGGG